MNRLKFFLTVAARIAMKELHQTLENSTEVCYPEVGCFETGPPWPGLNPENPSEVSTDMYFYSRNTSKNGVTFSIYPEIDLSEVQLDKEKQTFFIIHGFTDSGMESWILQMKDVLLKISDVNVFIVNWPKGADGPYSQAVGNTRTVGVLGTLVLEKAQIDLEKLNIIGHSLGAQVASYIGKNFIAKGKQVNRITALDPAGPLFQGAEPRVRLNATDARVVVALHTNAGGFGMLTPEADVDFYFNGGTAQPGCPPIANDITEENIMLSCSHERSYEYFTEALNSTNCTMEGKPATVESGVVGDVNTVTQGILVKKLEESETSADGKSLSVGLNTEGKGVYQVLTEGSSPFCVPDA